MSAPVAAHESERVWLALAGLSLVAVGGLILFRRMARPASPPPANVPPADSPTADRFLRDAL